jgi:hypothetical protein
MSDLSPLERAILRKQAFDNEFEIEVAAQSNYTGPEDMADVSRYHGFRGLNGTRDLNLHGFYVPPTDKHKVGEFRKPPYWGIINGLEGEAPKEVGTVNALHNQATPQTWAHEYRHRDFPNWSEGPNRLMDFATAQNQQQQDSASRMLADWSNRRRDSLDYQRTPSDEMMWALNNLNQPLGLWRGSPYSQMITKEWNRGARSTSLGKAEDIDDYFDQRHESAFFQKTSDEIDEYLDWNKGLAKRNLQRRMNALPKGTPMERQFAKQEQRRLTEEYERHE